MRVTLLCLDSGVPFGGVKGCSIHLRSVARALLRADHAVQVVCVKEGPAAEDVRGHTLRIVSRGASETELAPLLADSDLVIERLALLAPQGAIAAARMRVPHLYEVNAPLDREAAEHRSFGQGPEARAAFSRGFSHSQGALAVSSEVGRWVNRLAPAGYPVKVVPNGVDPAFLEVPTADALRLAQSRIPPSELFRVGYVGSFKPWHDLGTLVEAAAGVVSRPVELVMIGHGPRIESVLQHTADRGVPAIMVGPVPHAEVAPLMRCCDAIAVPYATADAYFSPLKLVEAMAVGRPVVASSTEPCRQVISHMKTGLLVQPGNPGPLTAALDLLARDPLLRERIGAAAQDDARLRWTWDAAVDGILDFAERTRRKIHA